MSVHRKIKPARTELVPTRSGGPHLSAVAFVAGFIWDSVMLERVDQLFANLMLGTYLVLSVFIIFIVNVREARRLRQSATETAFGWLPVILQFCFGSLVSAYIIFYTQSASLANWPFIAFLGALVFSNEVLRSRYLSPILQFSVFFIVLFSYAVFSLPVLLGRMGGDVFVISGLASLAVVATLAVAVHMAAPEALRRSRLPLAASILGIYALFNIAYFKNLIPPIPLALREIGVYHSAARREDGSYTLRFEPSRWYPFVGGTSPLYSRAENEPAYAFSAVFAPTRLATKIFHTWSYFDPTDKVWVTTDRIEFRIAGGREEGYRGYTTKQSIFPTSWRVDVETARHERIGRIEFEVVATTTPVTNLVTRVI